MICVVEDDPNIREIEVYAMKDCHMETKEASCAKEFWKLCENEVPELVLLDIMLPDEDGISIVKKMREAPSRAIYTRFVMWYNASGWRRFRPKEGMRCDVGRHPHGAQPPGGGAAYADAQPRGRPGPAQTRLPEPERGGELLRAARPALGGRVRARDLSGAGLLAAREDFRIRAARQVLSPGKMPAHRRGTRSRRKNGKA